MDDYALEWGVIRAMLGPPLRSHLDGTILVWRAGTGRNISVADPIFRAKTKTWSFCGTTKMATGTFSDVITAIKDYIDKTKSGSAPPR